MIWWFRRMRRAMVVLIDRLRDLRCSTCGSTDNVGMNGRKPLCSKCYIQTLRDLRAPGG